MRQGTNTIRVCCPAVKEHTPRNHGLFKLETPGPDICLDLVSKVSELASTLMLTEVPARVPGATRIAERLMANKQD